MNNWLGGLHLTFAALWIGCILTEALFERALLAGDRASHLQLARLHARVDLLVEMPAFMGVLLTGIILSIQAHSGSIAFMTMVLCCAVWAQLLPTSIASGSCFSAVVQPSMRIGSGSTGSTICNTRSAHWCCCLLWWRCWRG